MPNYAALDIGTNSFHLVIAEKKSDNSFRIIDREREVIRLGSELGKELNTISENEIRSAVTVLKRFAELAASYKTGIYTAATSAVREAKNREEFLSRVLSETGVKINVIEGEHEARLIYTGAEKALSLENKKALCIDIGGGSTECIFSNNGNIIFAESIKIGAVRMSKKFFPGFILSDENIKQCTEFVESEFTANKNLNFNADYNIAAGTSGTIISIGRMIYIRRFNELPSSLNGFAFSLKELDIIYNDVLSAFTLEERKKLKGIEEKRADILPAGLIILKTLFGLFKINKIRISEYALREGMLLEMMNFGA